jgi:hypothetical protein
MNKTVVLRINNSLFKQKTNKLSNTSHLKSLNTKWTMKQKTNNYLSSQITEHKMDNETKN